MLSNLSSWLDDAQTLAEAKGFDPDRFVHSRLAVDQFELARQVQSACDTAKFIVARLAGVDVPSHSDEESSLAELKERIASVVAILDAVEEDAFDGYEGKRVELPFLPEGTWMTGLDYLTGFALPNFFFHVTTAYAILRRDGLPLGKRAYLGSIPLQHDAPA